MSEPQHIVVTVHGIRTFGHWQSRLQLLLYQKDPSIIVRDYGYGYFSTIAFLIPPLRWLVTLRFRKELRRIFRLYPEARIDLVGHSFGTHLIGWGYYGIQKGKRRDAMLFRIFQKLFPGRKNPFTPQRDCVHTIILAGSVLRKDFDWGTLLEAGHVQRVINECGIQDLILIFNQVFVLFTGMAGRFGFSGMMGNNFRNRFFAGGHSLYFKNAEFMKQYWIPLLTTTSSIEQVDQRHTPTLFQGVVTTVLQNLGVPKLIVYTVLLLTPAVKYYLLFQEAEKQRLRANLEAQNSDEQRKRAELARDQTLDTLQWVFNQTALMPFNEASLDKKTAQLIEGVIRRLGNTGFDGIILFERHIGRFIVIDRANGEREIATNDKLRHLRPGDTVSHVSDGRGFIGDYDKKIAERLVDKIRGMAASIGFKDRIFTGVGSFEDEIPYPNNYNDVDSWNRVAALNNRIQMTLIKMR